jgi:hypothetical protein
MAKSVKSSSEQKTKTPETVAEHFVIMTSAAIRNGDRYGYSRLVDGVEKTSFAQVATLRGTYYIFHDKSWVWVSEHFWMPGQSIKPPFADSEDCGITGKGCVCAFCHG